MCTYSLIVDHYRDRWTPLVPQPQTWPNTSPQIGQITFQPLVSPEEVAEFRRLLDRAREYDRTHNQPNCELDEKKKALKALAQQLGVDISFIDEAARTHEEATATNAVDPHVQPQESRLRAAPSSEI
jgi:hypothetical protein